MVFTNRNAYAPFSDLDPTLIDVYAYVYAYVLSGEAEALVRSAKTPCSAENRLLRHGCDMASGL